MAKKKEATPQAREIPLLEATPQPISSVKPNHYNPYEQPPDAFELLVRSILEEGYSDPILVHEETREIINGEHRWGAMLIATKLRQEGGPIDAQRILDLRPKIVALAEELGDSTKILVATTKLSRAQMRMSTVRRNRARGEEVLPKMATVLRDLEDMGALPEAKEQLLLSEVDLDLLNYDPGQLLDPNAAAGASSFAGAGAGTDNAWEGVGGDEAAPPPPPGAPPGSARPRPDLAPFKLLLVFNPEEAKVVKAVLGENPAAQVYRLCREAQEREQREAPSATDA